MPLRLDLLLPAVIYYLVAGIGVGIYCLKKYGKAARDFTVASRILPWWLVFTGAVLVPFGAGHTISPAEATWVWGAGPLWWPVVGGVTSLLVLFFAVGRMFRALGVPTVGAACELAFGPLGRVLLVATTCLHQIMIAGLQIYGTASALYGFTGLDMSYCIIAASVITIVYVLLAGVLQMAIFNLTNLIVYYIGFGLALAAMAEWLKPVGGWSVVEQDIAATMGPKGTSLLFYPGMWEMVMILAIPIAISHLAAVCMCQGAVQPVLAAKDPKEVVKGWPLAVVLNGMASLPWVLAGLLALCAPLTLYGPLAPVIESLRARRMAVPAVIMTITSWWPAAAAGMLLALMAATMSTAAAFVLGSATALTEDIVRRFWRPDLSERSATLLQRVLIIVATVIAVLSAFLKPFLMGAFIWIFTFYIPLFVSMLYAVAWRRNTKAMLATTLACWVLNFLWGTIFQPAIVRALPPFLRPGPGVVYPVTVAAVVLYPILALVWGKESQPALLKVKSA